MKIRALLVDLIVSVHFLYKSNKILIFYLEKNKKNKDKN